MVTPTEAAGGRPQRLFPPPNALQRGEDTAEPRLPYRVGRSACPHGPRKTRPGPEAGRWPAVPPRPGNGWHWGRVCGRIHCGESFPDPKEACPETVELFLYKGGGNNSFYGLFFPLRELPSYNLWFAQRQHLQPSSPVPYCFLLVVP